MGKHYDRTINKVNEQMSLLVKGTQRLRSYDKILALTTITSVLSDIDVNLAAIADALEEKKDDKA